MLELQKYNLPDQELLNSTKSAISTWVPDKTYVILGQRDNIEDAVEDKAAIQDNVAIMQRPSGGHSVVLTPNTIVVSIISFQSSLTAIKTFFKDCNMIIINALKKQNVDNLSILGISDIVLNGKKIVGSSMYKGKDHLFFHAVVNIAEQPDVIAKYLKHPKTEPEYRKKRNHAEFITSLSAQGYEIKLEKLIVDINISSVN